MNEFPGTLDDLASRGWGRIPRWIDEPLTRSLVISARALHDAGHFSRAGVGRGKATRIASDVRHDEICWLERGSTPSIDTILDRLEDLRVMLNREFFLGLREFEAHFAIYQPGGSYARHLDRFRDDDSRTISAVVYLNDEWKSGDGGELAIFDTTGETLIEPVGGTLVLFKSESIEHQVRTSNRERWSVTAWFRR